MHQPTQLVYPNIASSAVRGINKSTAAPAPRLLQPISGPVDHRIEAVGTPPNEIYISDAAVKTLDYGQQQMGKHHDSNIATSARPSAMPPAYRPASLPYEYMDAAHLEISEEPAKAFQQASERAVNKRLSPQPANLRAYGGEYISSQAGLYAAALRDLQVLEDDDSNAPARDNNTQQTRAVPVQLAAFPVGPVPGVPGAPAAANYDQRMMLS